MTVAARLATVALALWVACAGCESGLKQALRDASGAGGNVVSAPDATFQADSPSAPDFPSAGDAVWQTGGAPADGGTTAATGGIGGQVTGGAAGAEVGGAAGSAGFQGAGGAGPGGAVGTGGAAGTGAADCGNGEIEPGEQCDCGRDVVRLPAGCVGINGLFFGNGSGCSTGCRREPTCLDSSGKTQACTSICGDGSQDPAEACDDGNLLDGDGCSHDCKIEPGFTCQVATPGDACQSGQGECLQLPVVYRDFEGENTGGHPDFHFLGSHWNGAKTATTICVPDSSGPGRGGDATARCWGIAADALADAKPQLGPTTTCKCQFSDWSIGASSHIPGGYSAETNDSPLSDGKGSYIGVNGPSLQPVSVTGPSGVSTGRVSLLTSMSLGPPIFLGTVPVVKDAASFRQWYMDDGAVNRTYVSTLELRSLGSGLFQYTNQPFLGQGGFFPLDSLNPAAANLCNMFPYWNHGNGAPIWSSCAGDQYLFPPRVTASDCQVGDLVDDGCWAQVTGETHDYFFTTEARTTFVYDAAVGLSLQLATDGDAFAFINGQLVLDLGGFHDLVPGKVVIAGDPGKASITEGGCLDAAGNIVGTTPGSHACYPASASPPSASTPDDFRIRTVDLGLVTGKRYELALFLANRAPTESTLQITISGLSARRSVCARP